MHRFALFLLNDEKDFIEPEKFCCCPCMSINTLTMALSDVTFWMESERVHAKEMSSQGHMFAAVSALTPCC